MYSTELPSLLATVAETLIPETAPALHERRGPTLALALMAVADRRSSVLADFVESLEKMAIDCERVEAQDGPEIE